MVAVSDESSNVDEAVAVRIKVPVVDIAITNACSILAMV